MGCSLPTSESFAGVISTGAAERSSEPRRKRMMQLLLMCVRERGPGQVHGARANWHGRSNGAGQRIRAEEFNIPKEIKATPK